MSSPPPLLPSGLISLFSTIAGGLHLPFCSVSLEEQRGSFTPEDTVTALEHLLCTSCHPQKGGRMYGLAIFCTSGGLPLLPFTQCSAPHYSFSLAALRVWLRMTSVEGFSEDLVYGALAPSHFPPPAYCPHCLLLVLRTFSYSISFIIQDSFIYPVFCLLHLDLMCVCISI